MFKRATVTGILIAAAFVSAGAAVAGLGLSGQQLRYAEVLEVRPVEEIRRDESVATREVVGYDVRYRLGDEEGVVRLARVPGQRIPVQDGRLVVAPTRHPAG